MSRFCQVIDLRAPGCRRYFSGQRTAFCHVGNQLSYVEARAKARLLQHYSRVLSRPFRPNI